MKKSIMKLLSLLLLAAIMITMIPTSVLALSAYNLVSSNPRVVVAEDCIYVYSHSYVGEYKINSKKLIESLSSGTHSTISYLDNNKVETTVSIVTNGYIRLSDTKNETVYIPIKCNTENLWEENFSLGEYSSDGYYNRFDEESVASYSIGEAGIQKENNDTSYIIHGNGDTDIYPSGNGYASWLQKNRPGIVLDTVYTIEYSFLNQSTVSAYSSLIMKRENGTQTTQERLFMMNDDGSAYSGKGAAIGKLNKDEWHTVCITHDHGRTRILVTVDGVLVNDDAWSGADGGFIDYIKFGMAGYSDGTPAYGNIYYDDISIYGGYPKNDKYTPSLLSDDFYVDRKTKTIYGAFGKTSDEVLKSITSELNGDITIDTDVITSETVLTQTIVNFANQKYTYTYKFSDKDYISEPSITNTGCGSDDDLNIRLTVCPANRDSFSDLSLMLASYIGNRLTGVQLIPDEIKSKKNYDISLSQTREENVTTKLFLWDKNMHPLYGEDITSYVDRPTMIKDDSLYKNIMSDYIAIHSRSGLITSYGNKYLLTNKPYTEDSTVYIPLKETADFLGVPHKASDTEYICAKDFFENYMNLTVSEFESEHNSGVVIAGQKSFDEENAYDAQALNDYLFNYRPSPDEILKKYNSSNLKGQHPRIYVSSKDIERIKSECETNEYMKSWKSNIIAACNWISTLPVVEYKIIGSRLLSVSRKVLSYMHTYGMAYLLTGDDKYAQKAFTQLQAAANFPDWNPDHALDTAEMAAAFAVGYDWMYDGFTEEQRKIIEDAFCRHGIAAANNLYEGVAGRTSSVVCDINWNAVVNGGLSTGAFAFMDVYPQNSSHIIAYAFNGLGELLNRFAPMGAWFEGPGYWEYTIKYMTKMLSNSERILGTEYGITRCEGFETTADYIFHMQSHNGTYAYGDCMATSNLYVPEIFWLSHILDKPEYTSTLLHIKNGVFSDYEDIALALCWYDTSILPKDIHLNNDIWLKGEDVIAMRSGWTQSDSYFAAQGGFSSDNHSHLDSGSFIYESNGVRWAHDLGQGNYDNPIYRYTDAAPGGERWKIFRLRAEAHNTIFINPTTNEDHKVDTAASIERFETNSNSGITVLNMTDTLSDNVNTARRGFAFCDNKTSLVIRDEINLLNKNKSNDVYWVMMTKADVEILSNGTGAILTQDDEVLYLNFVHSGADNSNISVAPAAPIDTTGVVISETSDDSYNRILIKLTSSEKIELTVSLSSQRGTLLLNRYNKAISDWILE